MSNIIDALESRIVRETYDSFKIPVLEKEKELDELLRDSDSAVAEMGEQPFLDYLLELFKEYTEATDRFLGELARISRMSLWN